MTAEVVIKEVDSIVTQALGYVSANLGVEEIEDERDCYLEALEGIAALLRSAK